MHTWLKRCVSWMRRAVIPIVMLALGGLLGGTADATAGAVAGQSQGVQSGQTSGPVTPEPEKRMPGGGQPASPEETKRREEMLERTHLPGPMPPPGPPVPPQPPEKGTETTPPARR